MVFVDAQEDNPIVVIPETIIVNNPVDNHLRFGVNFLKNKEWFICGFVVSAAHLF